MNRVEIPSAVADADAICKTVNLFVSDEFDVILTNVGTEDGFVIHQARNWSDSLEEDKMAAVSSALLSLAEATVKGIRAGGMRRIIIESDAANVLVMRVQRRTAGLVLTIVSSKKMSVGKAIYLADQLAAELRED